jgi:hypothetical protein
MATRSFRGALLSVLPSLATVDGSAPSIVSGGNVHRLGRVGGAQLYVC